MADPIKLIQKCLKLAENAGSEAEAALAVERARELMHKHQISEAMLRLHEASEAAPVEEIIKGKVTNTRKKVAWHMAIADSVDAMFGCHAYWHGGEIMFFGRLSAVQAATYTTQYLINEVEAICNQEAPSRIYDRSYRNAFRLGCANRIGVRIDRQTDERKRTEEKARKAREAAHAELDAARGMITDEQIKVVLGHARAAHNTSLAACAVRALDGDSLYDRDLRERCADEYRKIETPLCMIEMHCLCAGHARGNDAGAPCDTSESEPIPLERALAVIAKDQAEVDEKYEDFMHPRMKNGKRRKKGVSIGAFSSSDGYHAGRTAGGKVNINTVARGGLPRGQGSLK